MENRLNHERIQAEQKIDALYKGNKEYSLLGCAINRILKSKQPLADLAILDAFVSGMPADEFQLFSGFDVWSAKTMEVGTSPNENLGGYLHSIEMLLEDRKTAIPNPICSSGFEQGKMLIPRYKARI